MSYKTLIDAKPLRVKFDKRDGFIRTYDGTRYLLLFGSEKYDFIYSRIKYLIGVKSGITYAISPNYAKIKVDSYGSLFHAILNIKEGDYCCVISRISKSEAVNLWQNIHLTEKSETSQNIQLIITYKNG